jgi:hypothetical protein
MTVGQQVRTPSQHGVTGMKSVRPTSLALLSVLAVIVTSACSRGASTSSPPQGEIRTKNATALAASGDTIPMFEFTGVSPAYALFKGKEHYKSQANSAGKPNPGLINLPECPPLEKVIASASANDEFERRDQERRVDAAIDECFQKFQSPSYPKLMAVRIPLPRNKYDFTAGAFELSFPRYVTKVQYLTHLSFEGDAMSVQLFPDLDDKPGTWDKHNQITWSIEAQRDGLLVLSGGTDGPFSYLGLKLTCPEAAARELKAALERSPPSLDIAFEPRDFGRTGLTLEGPLGAEEKLGVRGRAVGYRVVHGDRVLVPWTPFGLDADGKDPAPSISL